MYRITIRGCGKVNKKLIISIILTISIVFIALNFTLFKENKPSAKEINPKVYLIKEERLTDTININGVVDPLNEQSIYYDSSKGLIKSFYVNVGDNVKKGDKLFSYQDSNLKQEIQQAGISKSRALIQLDKINYEIRKKDGQLKQAEKLNQKELKKQILEEKNSLEYDKKIANLDFKDALSKLNAINKDDLTIKSSIDDGIVSKVSSDISAGNATPIINVISKNKYVITGDISEYDVPYLDSGMKVSIKIKALPGQTLKGEFISISDYPNQSISESETTQSQLASYPFKIKIEGDVTNLRKGYLCNIEVRVNRKEKKPVVPVESILTDENGEYVFLVKNHNLRKTYIKTGVLDQGFKEVVSGLKVKEKIIQIPTNELKDGMEWNAND